MPDELLGHERARTEATEILEKLRKSSESWHTHLLNAEIQKYNPYWVAVLILGAERSSDPRQFLTDFVLENVGEDRKLSWPGYVAGAILKASR